MEKVASIFLVFAFLVSVAVPAQAGVPLNNLEGVGGIALNPVAYLAGNQFTKNQSDASTGSEQKKTFSVSDLIRKPQAGAWYVSLPGAAGVNWTSVGIADTVLNRIEFSYGFETVRLRGGSYHYKNDVGAKLLVLPEGWNPNWKAAPFLPAISVGTIWKNTTDVGPGVRSNGVDAYVVATKLVTQLPLKVLLSGGGLLTQGHVTGLLGYDKKSVFTFFGNADVLLTDKIAVGYEFKQGAKFDSFKNASYQDAHIAYFPTKNISLVLAYVYAGQTHKPTVGLGSGVVASVHYAF